MAEVEIPKEWKPAGAGEEELDYVLYHIKGSGTNASATLQFFNVDEATDGIAVTNMPLKSQLPSTQRFLVKEIRINLDPISAGTDINSVLDNAILDFYIQNKRVLCLPAIECVSPAHIIPSGVTQDEDRVAGEGFKLDRAVMIPGGTTFRVEFTVGKTAPSASTDIYVELRGRLVRPA